MMRHVTFGYLISWWALVIPLLRLTLSAEEFPWDDLRKILHGGQQMASVHSGEKYCRKLQPPE